MHLLFIFLLLPFLRCHYVDFGLILKGFRGFEDEILFGKVFLYTETKSSEFKDVISKCLEDYISSDIRPSGYLNGIIKSIRDPTGDETGHTYGLAGDVHNFQNYLALMLLTYYEENDLLIKFNPFPILRQSCGNRAAIGEIVSFEYSQVFTGFDDHLLNFFVSFGDGSHDSDNDSNQSDNRKSILSKTDENDRDKTFAVCKFCTIS